MRPTQRNENQGTKRPDRRSPAPRIVGRHTEATPRAYHALGLSRQKGTKGLKGKLSPRGGLPLPVDASALKLQYGATCASAGVGLIKGEGEDSSHDWKSRVRSRCTVLPPVRICKGPSQPRERRSHVRRRGKALPTGCLPRSAPRLAKRHEASYEPRGRGHCARVLA